METLKCLLFQWYRLRRIVNCSHLVLATNWVSSAQAAYVDALVAPDLQSGLTIVQPCPTAVDNSNSCHWSAAGNTCAEDGESSIQFVTGPGCNDMHGMRSHCPHHV